jgi:hypothetical protein
MPKDPETGDVILSRESQTWDSLFARLEKTPVPADFLSPEERREGIYDSDRDPFEGYKG